MGVLPGVSLLRLQPSNRHRRLLLRRVRLGRDRSAVHFSVGLARLRDHGKIAIEGRQSVRNRHHRERKYGLDGVALWLSTRFIPTDDPSFGVSVFGVYELSHICPGLRELGAGWGREYLSRKINGIRQGITPYFLGFRRYFSHCRERTPCLFFARGGKRNRQQF